MLLLLLVCILVACAPAAKAEVVPINTPSQATVPPPKVPAPFFDAESYTPLDVGMVFSYDVQINRPLIYWEILWPEVNSDSFVIGNHREAFIPNIGISPKELNGELTLKIKRHAVILGCFGDEGEGVEIEVVADTFDLFQNVKQIFWVKSHDNLFEVLIHSSKAPYAPRDSFGKPFTYDGCSIGLLYFSPTYGPFIERSLSFSPKKQIDPIDRAQSMWFDKNVPNYTGVPLVYIHRIVKADYDSEYWAKGFIVDTLFAPGKGLILLEQRVDNKITMTWTRK